MGGLGTGEEGIGWECLGTRAARREGLKKWRTMHGRSKQWARVGLLGNPTDGLTRNLGRRSANHRTWLTHSTNAPAAGTGNDLELDGETIESNWSQVTDKWVLMILLWLKWQCLRQLRQHGAQG